MKNHQEEWEPTPQRKPFREIQEELRIGILPEPPPPGEKPKSPYDITPIDHNDHVGDD